ncbi:MAG: hypothetical protein ACP5NS_04270 [Candidatus Pacearchaeota archaeon]
MSSDVYSDESVSLIALNYGALMQSLTALKEAREGRDGAIVFGHVAEHYIIAEKAKKELTAIPRELREKLKLGDLERQLSEFGNLPIQSPFWQKK